LQLEDEDAGDELVRQLRAYKQFKEAAKYLEELQTRGQRSFVRLVPHPQISTGIEHLEAVPLEALVSAARRAIQALSSSPPPDHPVSPPAVTITDQIQLITEALTKQPRISFTNLLAAAYSRREVIITLLAVLELIKRQKVQAQQERLFGEIVISTLTEQKPVC
jgi:segregation and condensation protein A